MAPDGSFVVAGDPSGRVVVLPLDGGPYRELRGFTDGINGVAVGPQARLVAAGSGLTGPAQAFVRVWDLESEEVRTLDAGDGGLTGHMWFTGEGDLLVDSGLYFRHWDLDWPEPRLLEEMDLSGP